MRFESCCQRMTGPSNIGSFKRDILKGRPWLKETSAFTEVLVLKPALRDRHGPAADSPEIADHGNDLSALCPPTLMKTFTKQGPELRANRKHEGSFVPPSQIMLSTWLGSGPSFA